MSAELTVDRKNIEELFTSLKNGEKFIIPDYQRPYQWDVEKCETLWNDIVSFFDSDECKNEKDYFLGTIVSYKNEQGNLEIIDGQQRITSLMLLLKSFHSKMLNMNQDDPNIKGLTSTLSSCLWEVGKKSKTVEDINNVKLYSEVATSNEGEKFHQIISQGIYDEKSNDNYSKNYHSFINVCSAYASQKPIEWEDLCLTILDKCIIFPIVCEDQDTALTIFSTLNDRGMPLSDSDIFKAKIYKFIDKDNRKEFIERWKVLSDNCIKANISIDDVFRYYYHVIRARNDDTSKEIALRKFYLNNIKYLQDEIIIEDLIRISNFWLSVNNPDKSDDDIIISTENRKLLQCLALYPNEYWKYVLSVFFHCNYKNKNFDGELNKVLSKTISYLFTKFIDTPSVNAIKIDVFKYCSYLSGFKEGNNSFSIKDLDSYISNINNKISNVGTWKISKAIILLHSYISSKENQVDLIPNNFDIEHIFPKKWQDANYNGWLYSDAESYLERLGNKIPLEKKLNIQAGNGYFGNKKYKYKNSNIYEVKCLGDYHKNDWVKSDIDAREKDLIRVLTNFFRENL